MRISDWSSDVCSSDLATLPRSALSALIRVIRGNKLCSRNRPQPAPGRIAFPPAKVTIETISRIRSGVPMKLGSLKEGGRDGTLVVVSRDLSQAVRATGIASTLQQALEDRSEEHTSELQSLMRISYAVFCLK